MGPHESFQCHILSGRAGPTTRLRFSPSQHAFSFSLSYFLINIVSRFLLSSSRVLNFKIFRVVQTTIPGGWTLCCIHDIMFKLNEYCGWWISAIKIYTDRTPIIQAQEPDWKDLAGWLDKLKLRIGLNGTDDWSGSWVLIDLCWWISKIVWFLGGVIIELRRTCSIAYRVMILRMIVILSSYFLKIYL